MLRKVYTTLSVFLVSVTCINGLSRDAVLFEIPVVNAPEGPMKVRPQGKHSNDEEYALTALAIPYIKDDVLRKSMERAYWCGTPTGYYLSRNPRPSKEHLVQLAARIEARNLKN